MVVEEWFDKTSRYTWIDGIDIPIYAEPHGLDFLTAASVRVKGKRFFDKPERQNEPFLFSVLTSGIWPLQNSMLTAMAENVTKLINSAFIFKPDNSDAVLETIHHEIIGNVVRANGSLTPMAKDLINKDTSQLWQLIDNIFQESTMRGQDAGIGGSSPFSMVALLGQMRRLPIIPVQRSLRVILAQLMEIAFRWWKKEGKTYNYVADFKPAEIPDVIDFDVTVEPDLPQDKVQMAGVVESLTRGEDPILPKRWGREFMGEGQSDEIQKEIWTERIAEMAFQMGGQQLLQQLMQPPPPPDNADSSTVPPDDRSAQNMGGPTNGMPVSPEVMPPEMQAQSVPNPAAEMREQNAPR